MHLRVGDYVGYKNVPTDPEFKHKGVVTAVNEDGVESYPHPVLWIAGKSGFVLPRNCTLLHRGVPGDEPC